MADICVIYAHEDRGFVADLVNTLTNIGWTVWWDERIHQGDFSKHIEDALLSARCVLPIWSPHSIAKDWVRDEARFAKDARKPLYPLSLNGARLPLGFGQLQTVHVVEANQVARKLSLDRIVEVLRAGIGLPLPKWDGHRSFTFKTGEKQVQLPCFMRSVSSYETQLRPDSALQALHLQGAESILASAYDVVRAPQGRKLSPVIRKLMKDGRFVVLDSGNYEAYRKKDKNWGRNLFVRGVKLAKADYVFCFDNLKPALHPKAIVSQVVRGIRQDREQCKSENIVPVVHIPTKRGIFETALLPELMCAISQELHPPFIAVPERELGNGIIEKARTVARTRSALNTLGYYQPIHLLGTGNPISYAILSAVGADLFDGLEWCRTVADHESGLLYHFQQYDFFKYQTRLVSSPVVKAAVDDEKVSFNAKVAFHNLEFLSAWILEVQKNIHAGTMDRMLVKVLPKGAFDDIASELPDVFK